jgi:type IV secretion system protein VirD4
MDRLATRFQAQLGHPWFEVFGWPVYYPPVFFWWWFIYDAYARDIFTEGGYIAASGGIAAIVVAIAMSVWRAREVEKITTYGSARWAAASDSGEPGCFSVMAFGQWRSRYLRHDGPEHVLCFAPTRSGKGAGLVVPTLLTWPGSAIVHDIKGENWTLTAGWRARFGRVLLFDPTNSDSAAYNPLLEVRRGDCEVRDVQNIADILVDPEGALERRNHWEKTSHSLLVGTILHMLYAAPDKTLAGVANFLSDPTRPFESTLDAMMTTRISVQKAYTRWSPAWPANFSTRATMTLGVYRRDVIPRLVAILCGSGYPECDWRIRDLVGATTTLYLVVPPSDISEPATDPVDPQPNRPPPDGKLGAKTASIGCADAR